MNRLYPGGGRVATVKDTPGDGTFDLVVSCLTFHEVGDVRDRTVCLKEALRVLAPGGHRRRGRGARFLVGTKA